MDTEPSRDAPEFLYHPLDASTDEIRLVRIIPGDDESDLHCELIHVSLTDSSYEALSYPWKDWPIPEDNANIFRESEVLFINNQKLEIGHNLAKYLRTARTLEERRGWVWIDAICINQQDIE